MSDIFKRTELLLGEENVKNLERKHVAVFGVGGVGGYVCEALARSGIGKMTIVDKDVVSVSNINRQIIALNSTVGTHGGQALPIGLSHIAEADGGIG